MLKDFFMHIFSNFYFKITLLPHFFIYLFLLRVNIVANNFGYELILGHLKGDRLHGSGRHVEIRLQWRRSNMIRFLLSKMLFFALFNKHFLSNLRDCDEDYICGEWDSCYECMIQCTVNYPSISSRDMCF